MEGVKMGGSFTEMFPSFFKEKWWEERSKSSVRGPMILWRRGVSEFSES